MFEAGGRKLELSARENNPQKQQLFNVRLSTLYLSRPRENNPQKRQLFNNPQKQQLFNVCLSTLYLSRPGENNPQKRQLFNVCLSTATLTLKNGNFSMSA